MKGWSVHALILQCVFSCCVSSGGASTPAGTSVFTKHIWDMGMGYLHVYGLMVGHLSLNGQGICHLVGGGLWFNGWGTYCLNECGSNGKLLFHLEICSKMLVFRGVPFPIIA